MSRRPAGSGRRGGPDEAAAWTAPVVGEHGGVHGIRLPGFRVGDWRPDRLLQSYDQAGW